MEKAYDGTLRLQTLVKNLLSASRIEMNRLEFNYTEVSLGEIAYEVYREFKGRALSRNLRFEIFIQKDLPILKIDRERVKEVMEIFVDNALKYTLEGFVRIKLFKEENNIIFIVEDSGIGVPQSFRSRMFKKFSRAENVGMIHPEGTGLGLHIAKVIISKLKGEIIFESQEGRGSTFGFRLPVA